MSEPNKPTSFRRRRRRAAADTEWLNFRRNIVVPGIGIVLGVARSFVLGTAFSQAAIETSIIGVVALLLVGLSQFVWNFARAGDRNALDDERLAHDETRALLAEAVANVREEKVALALNPKVETSTDSRWFHVGIEVSSVDGKPHPNCQGRLVRLEPIAPDPAWHPSIAHAAPSGSLQWSLLAGTDRPTVTNTPTTLDVLAFENSDRNGIPIYVAAEIRGQHVIDIRICPWRVTVEVVSSDGSSGMCTFELRGGETSRAMRTPSAGTLSAPQLLRTTLDQSYASEQDLRFNQMQRKYEELKDELNISGLPL